MNEEVQDLVETAHIAEDWPGILKWEARMDRIMEGQPDEFCEWFFRVFIGAHKEMRRDTGDPAHALANVGLHERRAELLGKMERFRDQGDAMCEMGNNLMISGMRQNKEGEVEDEAVQRAFQRARDAFQLARNLAEAHGFFSVECQACLGLGRLALRHQEDRTQEAVDLLKNALAAVLPSSPLTLNPQTSIKPQNLPQF